MAQSPTKSTKTEKSKLVASPNAYVMAIFTAILTSVFSVVGSYYAYEFQAKHAISQKQFEHRMLAYTAFLEKIEHVKAPAISQILSIGSIADHLRTDNDIQAFEDRIANLLENHRVQDIYWQLNADLNMLRLHGTPQVADISNDILKSLLLEDREIAWHKYPSELVTMHDHRPADQEHVRAYGWTERVDSDDRLMIVMIAKLTQALIAQLRWEIRNSST